MIVNYQLSQKKEICFTKHETIALCSVVDVFFTDCIKKLRLLIFSNSPAFLGDIPI